MPKRDFLIVDVATAPLANAADYMDEPTAPSNYKNAETIAAYIAEKKAEGASACGLDMDLCRLTAIGMLWASAGESRAEVFGLKSEDGEIAALTELADYLLGPVPPTLVTFNGHAFDLPLLMRRARYLGVAFPRINTDRFRSPHRDLCMELCDNDVKRKRSLRFYAKRLGMTDLRKTLSGAEESRVHETGQWAELEASVRHDIVATYRLGLWLGVYEPVAAESAVA